MVERFIFIPFPLLSQLCFRSNPIIPIESIFFNRHWTPGTCSLFSYYWDLPPNLIETNRTDEPPSDRAHRDDHD
jgi:hypothetical protein